MAKPPKRPKPPEPLKRKRSGKAKSPPESKKSALRGGRKVRPTGKASKPTKGRSTGVREGHGRSPRRMGPLGGGKRKAPPKPRSKQGGGRLGRGKKSVPHRRVAKKPYRDDSGRFSKRPAPKPKKRPPRKPPPRKPPPRKQPPRKPPAKKPPPRKPKKRPPTPPPPPPPPPKKKRPPRGPSKPKKPPKKISDAAFIANDRISAHLASLLEGVVAAQLGLDTGVKSFINQDGSVDGEVRIGNLPDDWRVPDGLPQLKEFLSTLLRQVGDLKPGPEGGAYWISIGVRFGPNNESEIGELAELYKRHRGLFQVASYALDASIQSAAQNAVVAIGEIVKAIMTRRGLPPSVIFIRYTWTPDGVRPHRYTGESGKEE